MKTLLCGQNLGVLTEKIHRCRWHIEYGKQIIEELKCSRPEYFYLESPVTGLVDFCRLVRKCDALDKCLLLIISLNNTFLLSRPIVWDGKNDHSN